MSAILRRSPADEPVYQFMDKKRAEGKPYRVYMMASANKFLRIYYSTVKQYLDNHHSTQNPLVSGQRQKIPMAAAWFCMPFLLCLKNYISTQFSS